MIKAITNNDNLKSFSGLQNKLQNNKVLQKVTGSNAPKYVDSFVKQTVKIAPVTLGFTGVLAISDSAKRNINMKKAVQNSFTKYFIPVTLLSSLVLAGIENSPKKS